MKAGFIKIFDTIIKLFATAAVTILYIHYFLPQSWGFYTIESKVPLYDMHMVRNGVADKKSFFNNNLSYGMGISRKGKILYNELYGIINNTSLRWKPLVNDSLNYITHYGKYIPISPGSEYNTLRGTFIITQTDRPSYLFLKTGKRFHASAQYILVEIR